MIHVFVNGSERQIDPPGSVNGLLMEFRIDPRLVVVERNGQIIRRAEYESEPVEEGDQLEIVQMMAGG